MNLVVIGSLSSHGMVYLANVVLASVLVCGLALSAVRAARRRSLPMRHAVCLIGLIVTLASPLIVGVAQFSGRSLIVIGHATDRPVSEASMELLPNEPLPLLPSAESEPPTVAAALQNPGTAAEINAAAPPRPVVLPEEIEALPPASRLSAFELARLLGGAAVLAWAAGCVIGMCRLTSGCLRLRHFMRHLQPVEDARVERLAKEAASQLRLSAIPPVYESHLLDGPVSVGLIRPRVVLPASMAAALDDEQLRGALLHELAHVIRRDHLVGLLQRLALVMFWWNPLLHRVCAQMSALREKICDDLATRGVESAHGYAAMLIELAGRVAVRSPLPATIGIFESSGREFRDRVCRLLDDRRPIVTQLDRRMKLAVAALCVVLIGLTALTTVRLAAAEAAPATESQHAVATGAGAIGEAERSKSPDISGLAVVQRFDDPPPVQWPAVLRGTIVDEEGKSIVGAQVRLDLKRIHEFTIGRWDEVASSQSLTTDETGEYRFDTSGFPEMAHRPFSITLSATATGYAEAKTWSWYSRRDATVGEHFRELVMVPGRVVRGRCVDWQGRPVAGAVVKAAADHDGATPSSWAWDRRATNEQGEFEISVPRDTERRIELWVVHPNWAPQHVVVPKTGDLADIRMQQGWRIEGRVLDEDGRPVAGTLVAARSIDDGNLKHVTFAAQVAVKTDAQGRYQLPPLHGMYKLFLSLADETDNRLDDAFLVASQPPPLVLPQKVAVSGPQPPLDFQAGPTLTVRGRVRWPDGEPVVGMEVRAVYLPPGFGTGVELGRAITDADGNHSFQTPSPIDYLSISAVGQHDAERKWHYAYADDSIEGEHVENKGLQFIRLKDLDRDVSGLDWVLRPDLP